MSRVARELLPSRRDARIWRPGPMREKAGCMRNHRILLANISVLCAAVFAAGRGDNKAAPPRADAGRTVRT